MVSFGRQTQGRLLNFAYTAKYAWQAGRVDRLPPTLSIQPIPTMKKFLLTLIIASGLTAQVMAQKAPPVASPTEPDLPDVVVNGFREYKSGGYTAATIAWAHDSNLLLDPQALQNLNAYLNLIGNNSGIFVAADVVRVVKLSNTTEEVYAVAKFERQVVYFAFTCYKAGDKWIITLINVNKDPAQVLPTNIMSGQ